MKRFFIVFFMGLMAFSATAQHKPYQFGFKASANIGWFGTNAEHFDNKGVKPGFSWGFVADFFLMENYSITTGFDMVFLNGKLSYPYMIDGDRGVTVDYITNTFKTRYIQLPVVLTMKTNEIKGSRYYGQIGGALGFLISAREEGDFAGETIKKSNSEMVNFFRGSFIFGAGIEIPLNGSTYIRTGIQFNNGFTDVLKGNNVVYPDIKNQARSQFFELNACILF